MRETLHFGKLEDAENVAILSQTYSLKYPNKAFLVWKLFFFFFGTIFCISANFRVLIPNIRIVFSNSYSKNTQNDIFGLKFKDFYFSRNFLNFQPKVTQIRHSLFQNWNFLRCTSCLSTSLRILIPIIRIF